MDSKSQTKSSMIQFREVRMQRWRQLAGDALSEMLTSEQRAFGFLYHESPDYRQVAIQVLSYHWKSSQNSDFARICEELSLKDEDEVRHSALLAFGTCYEYTDDVRVGALLARIVLDSIESPGIRTTAYQALLSVRKPHAKLALRPDYGLRDVDWQLVEESMDLSRRSLPIDPLAIFTSQLSEDEASAYRLYDRGLQAFRHGNYDGSVQYFTEALLVCPNVGAAYIERARAYVELARFDEAITDLNYVISRKPDSPDILRDRARVYRKKGAFELAHADERAALEAEKKG